MSEEDAASRFSRAVGDAVRRRREELKWSVSRLASEAGVARQTVANMEGTRPNPTLQVLYSVAVAMDLNLADLMSDLQVRPPVNSDAAHLRALLEEVGG